MLDFKKMFHNLHNREPMNSEIIDNLKDQIELSILKKIIADQESNKLNNINNV